MLGFRHIAHAQGKADILVNRHVGVERVSLKHHRHIAVFGVHIVHQLAIHPDLALARILQTGNHTHGRGLATTGRAQQH